MPDSQRLAPPPRPVPLSLAITRLFNGRTQILLLLFAVAMLAAWSFVPHADLAPLTFSGPQATTTGRVTRSVDTLAKADRQQIYANHYEFSVAGTTLQGVSYGESQEKGTPVTVEYRTAKPADSRIAGMRRDLFGPGVLFVLIFPVVFALMLFFQLKTNNGQVDLLRRGLVTDAVQNGYGFVGRGTLRLDFDFTTRNGKKATASRIVPGVTSSSMDEKKYPKGAVEPVLYDPDRPSNAALLHGSNKISVDADGQLAPRPVAAFLALIIPVLLVAWNLYEVVKHV